MLEAVTRLKIVQACVVDRRIELALAVKVPLVVYIDAADIVGGYLERSSTVRAGSVMVNVSSVGDTPKELRAPTIMLYVVALYFPVIVSLVPDMVAEDFGLLMNLNSEPYMKY